MEAFSGQNCAIAHIVQIDSLRPYDNNPRNHNRAQRRKLATLIQRFGQVTPIIVDQNFQIIDGHAVWEAMRTLGHDEISIVVVAGRTDPEIRALRLALNRIPQEAGWENASLRKELQDLVDLSFDLELTGFSAVEIDHYLNISESSAEPSIPLPELMAVSRRGDIWHLDQHRVGCGDALDGDFIARLLSGTVPSMAFVDPPYNLPIAGFVSGNGSVQHREFAKASGEMSESQFIGFLAKALIVLKSSIASGSVLYVCMDWRHLFELLCAAREAGLELINFCVWAKTTPGLGSFYRSQHELVAVFKCGDGEIRNNMAINGKRRNRSNLWL